MERHYQWSPEENRLKAYRADTGEKYIDIPCIDLAIPPHEPCPPGEYVILGYQMTKHDFNSYGKRYFVIGPPGTVPFHRGIYLHSSSLFKEPESTRLKPTLGCFRFHNCNSDMLAQDFDDNGPAKFTVYPRKGGA
jgi:hypothetical protein